jgi:hypothetical protein
MVVVHTSNEDVNRARANYNLKPAVHAGFFILSAYAF